MTKQQLLALLREAMDIYRYDGGSIDDLVESFNRANRVGDLELPDINKLKADAVREAVEYSDESANNIFEVRRKMKEYADKLDRGEI